MTLSAFLQIASFIVSSMVTVLVILTYRRSKRQEFENQLYRLKLDALAQCTYYMQQYFIRLDAVAHYFKKVEERKDKFEKEFALDLLSALNNSTYEAFTHILKQAAYFEKEIIVMAGDFVHNVFFDFPDKLPETKTALILVDNHYSEQLERGNRIIDLMRAKLNLDKIGESLFRRSK